MKNRTILILLSMVLVFGCNSNESKTEKKAVDEEKAEVETKQSTHAGACEKFLDDYEKWADEIIKTVEKAKKDPTDIQNTKKMMEATQDKAKWSKKWTS